MANTYPIVLVTGMLRHFTSWPGLKLPLLLALPPILVFMALRYLPRRRQVPPPGGSLLIVPSLALLALYVTLCVRFFPTNPSIGSDRRVRIDYAGVTASRGHERPPHEQRHISWTGPRSVEIVNFGGTHGDLHRSVRLHAEFPDTVIDVPVSEMDRATNARVCDAIYSQQAATTTRYRHWIDCTERNQGNIAHPMVVETHES